MVSQAELDHPARLKIERAAHHITDLQREIQAFLASKPFKFVTREDPHTGAATHFTKAEKPIPETFSLIIGDAVHNMRSALDHLMFSILADKVPIEATAEIQFPFARSESALPSTLKLRKVHLAGDKVVAEITALKPYPSTDANSPNFLHSLHRLDNTDKHRLILTVGNSAAISGDEFRKIAPGIQPLPGQTFVFQEGTKLRVQGAVPRAPRKIRRAYRNKIIREYERDIQPAFDVSFGEGQPLNGYPVTPTLGTLLFAVMDAVARIKAAYLSP